MLTQGRVRRYIRQLREGRISAMQVKVSLLDLGMSRENSIIVSLNKDKAAIQKIIQTLPRGGFERESFFPGTVVVSSDERRRRRNLLSSDVLLRPGRDRAGVPDRAAHASS